MTYRLKIVVEHPKGWIEGETLVDKEFDLITDAVTELNLVLGHQIGFKKILLVHLEKQVDKVMKVDIERVK